MNNVYDLAHQLARAIKNSEEYKNYIEKKNLVYSDEKNKQMVEDFREKVFNIQLQQMTGKEVSQEEVDKIKKLEDILRLNPTINDFLAAEFRYSRLIEDISRIIGEAIDIDNKI
ncbi:MAG: YlbF family regulator [Tissierellia bacterium]|nr:YlbF family regulator [Tissierellia bacterium]